MPEVEVFGVKRLSFRKLYQCYAFSLELQHLGSVGKVLVSKPDNLSLIFKTTRCKGRIDE